MSDQENENNVNNTENQNNTNTDKEIDYSKMLENESVKQYLSKLVEEQTKALKDKNTELLNELKPIKTKLKEDVTLKMLSEGKHEEVFNKVKEERDAEWRERLNNKEVEFNTEKQELLKYKEKVTDFIFKDKFSEVASNTRLNKTAYNDALEKVKSEFTINESGEIISKENKLNSNGKPLTLNDWIDNQIKERPFWFDGVSGAGTQNHQSTVTTTGKKMTPDQIKNLSIKEYKEMKKKGLI